MDPLRKAAIVLQHLEQLEPEQAGAMLRQVGPQMAARLRIAVDRLGHVSAEEQGIALADFMRRNAPPQRTVVAVDDGVELETSAAAHQPPPPAYVASRPHEAKGNVRFAFLASVPTDFLFSLIQRESSQVSAVVVAHLPPVAAAALLGRMTAERQTDVLRRVAMLDELQPEIVSEIERHLEAVCFEHRRQKERRQAGAAAVNAILQAAPSDQRSVLSGSLARLGVEVADSSGSSSRREAPRPPIETARVDPTPVEPNFVPTPPTERIAARSNPTSTPPRSRSAAIIASGRTSTTPRSEAAPALAVKFAEFSQFDEATLATIFQQADPRTALLALAGAPRSLVERIISTLSEEEGEQLDRQIESIGPVRLRDIDSAQQDLARLAGELAGRRRIRLPAKSSLLTAEA